MDAFCQWHSDHSRDAPDGHQNADDEKFAGNEEGDAQRYKLTVNERCRAKYGKPPPFTDRFCIRLSLSQTE